jgi:hypothetical protein
MTLQVVVHVTPNYHLDAVLNTTPNSGTNYPISGTALRVVVSTS